MQSSRLGIFSDAVIAIILTILVLELKVPHGTGLDDLRELAPVFLSYLLSFVYVGIYWINHHHLLHQREISPAVMWANLHLLFWLSLFPFVTAWMGRNHSAPLPTALYGAVLVTAALAYWLLQQVLGRTDRRVAPPRWIEGGRWKHQLSLSLYLAGIALAAVAPHLGQLLFVVGVIWWIWPDRRQVTAPAGS